MDKPNITVKHSGWVQLQCHDDFPDGTLVIAEGERSIPFPIKRVYYITNLSNPSAVRGKHAHKKLEQYIFCVSGRFTLELDDGETKQRLVLDNPFDGVRLGARLWHTMSKFSVGCVLLVFASDFYESSDYSRDNDAFLEHVGK